MPLPFRLAVGLVVLATLLGLLSLFVLRRTRRVFNLSRRQTQVLTAALGVPFVLTLFFRGFGSRLPLSFGQPVAVAVSSAELGIAIAAAILGGAALVRRVATFIGRKAWARQQGAHLKNTSLPNHRPARAEGMAPPFAEASPEAETAPEDAALPAPKNSEIPESRTPQQTPKPPVFALSRREFVEKAVTTSALAVGGFSSAYGAMFGRHDYELSTVAVPIVGLSKAADNFTLVQLSDIHLGMMVGEGEMRAAEELARKARGDLIVLTGDLVDHDARYNERLGQLVRRLSGLAPVVAIPGNHDYYTGIQDVLSTLHQAGATVLVNQSTTILGASDGFTLAGLDDFSGLPAGGGPDLQKALSDLQAGPHGMGWKAPPKDGMLGERPTILLAHNPRTFLETAGSVALQLSGHTHGGQVNLGFRFANLVLRHGYVAGLYQNKGSHIYVNRGFGTAGPAARVGAPPEVSRIVLVSA